MIAGGLATAEEAVFDLDFHAVMHWGRDPVLEKALRAHASQRARSVLTFFARTPAPITWSTPAPTSPRATQAREVIAFCDHWKQVSGTDRRC